jgi:glycosyltransferase involved in cell wall biosynthesis
MPDVDMEKTRCKDSSSCAEVSAGSQDEPVTDQRARASQFTVAQVIGSFGGGGAQRLAYNLAVGLARRDVRSICIALRSAGGYVQQKDDGVETLDLQADQVGPLGRVRKLLELRMLLRTSQVDLVHVHGTATIVFVALALTGMRRRPLLWFTWHNSEFVMNETGFRGKALHWALRRCDRLFGASSSIVSRLRAQSAFSADIQVLRNGVPERPRTAGMKTTEPTVVWAARFVPPKDPQLLLRAAARLRHEGLRFRVIMAGDTLPHLCWFLDETRALADTLGIADVVSFPGWVEDLESLYDSAAIGVQTSHAEGLSMTLLEQMMAGLAVVATDVGDTKVAVRDSDTGLLIPPRDEQSLTSALRQVVADEDQRCRLGENAAKCARDEFSTDAMARRVVDLLKD